MGGRKDGEAVKTNRRTAGRTDRPTEGGTYYRTGRRTAGRSWTDERSDGLTVRPIVGRMVARTDGRAEKCKVGALFQIPSAGQPVTACRRSVMPELTSTGSELLLRRRGGGVSD